MNIRLIQCCFLILVSIMSAAVPAAATSVSEKKVELRIAYQPLASPAGAIMEAVKRDRLFLQAMARKGIELRFVPTLKGGDAVTAFRKGELDATTVGDMPLLELAFETPVTVIGQLKRNFASIVAPRGTTAPGLKGKRIGYAFATTGHYALLKTLQNGGLTERDVTLVPLDVSEMPDALLKGSVDAFAAWEPTPSQFLALHSDRYSTTGRQSSTAFMVVSKAYVGKNPESVQLLATSLARAMSWFEKDANNLRQAVSWNQTTIQKLTGKPSILSTEDLIRQITSDLQTISYSAKLSIFKDQEKNLLADELEFLKNIGKLPKSVQWINIRTSFDNRIMEKIYRKRSASLINKFDYEFK
ncbi:MAG: ABC transporter substrate-binding protein [Geobacteraceae bacterium]|nr:ABC transporter substrate-binding protein [Geobacteraceae bacterium]NTW80482.1 ABC transporter substrate-binding protein [Geobacteraceae bacterium]